MDFLNSLDMDTFLLSSMDPLRILEIKEERAAIEAALLTKKGKEIFLEGLQHLRQTPGGWKDVVRIARRVRARLEAEGLI